MRDAIIINFPGLLVAAAKREQRIAVERRPAVIQLPGPRHPSYCCQSCGHEHLTDKCQHCGRWRDGD